jgi:hypothetical protein
VLSEIKLHRPVTGEFVKGAPGVLVLWPHGGISMYCPGCGLSAGLDDHKVVLHDDDTVSVEPSVQCVNPECRAHFLVHFNRIQNC